MSFQYFKVNPTFHPTNHSLRHLQTEDDGFYYTSDHNYTTDWDFGKDLAPTHVIIHIGFVPNLLPHPKRRRSYLLAAQTIARKT